MFFVVSKVLHFILVPFIWLHGLMIGALFSKKRQKSLLITSLIVLYLYSTECLLYPIFKLWEYPMVWYKDIGSDYDAVIVLGGMAAPGRLPDDRTHFPGSPDRLLHALQLYKMGKARKIVISGGSGDLVGKRIPEAVYLRNVLLLCSVPEQDIIIESKSRNTRENALYSLDLVQTHFGEGGKYLIVTSAWHMRRSMACYQKVKMDVTAFPTDTQAAEIPTIFHLFIPNPTCPGKWNILFHEIVGFVSYKMAGYI